MIDSQFFYDWEERSYTIEKSVLDKIKTLQGKVEESAYYNDMVKWHFDGTDEELQDLWITMQFLSMTANPTLELSEKYNLTNKKYLINLMRHLYLDVEDYEDRCIMMGYKRPFGNSHIEGDVKEELEICGIVDKKNDDEYDDEYNYELENEVLKEFDNFIMDFFAGGFELKWYVFEKPKTGSGNPRENYKTIEEFWKRLGMDRIHSHMREQWKPTKSELISIVLNKILYNDL